MDIIPLGIEIYGTNYASEADLAIDYRLYYHIHCGNS